MRAAGEFLLVSALAAVVAVLAGGLSEAVVEQGTPVRAAAAAGYLAFLVVPFAFAISVVARLLLRAWRPAELSEAARDPVSGGVPRLVAWMIYLGLACFGLAAFVLQGMNRVVVASAERVIYVLSAPILAVSGAALLLLLSRPAVRGLTFALTALDRSFAARRGRPLLTPRLIVGVSAGGSALLLAGAWFVVIRPEIGHLDVSYVPSVALAGAVLFAAPLAWGALGRHRRARVTVVAVTGAALVVSLAAAVWLRYQRPFEMLAIWGESSLSGFAIDHLYDIEGMRGELDFEGFRPMEVPGAAHDDIVLVTIDTVRADRTPPYGGMARMPALAKLGQEGAVFQYAFAPGNVTRRSLPAMMMGVSAPRLRGRVAGWALKLDPRHVLVAERLRAAGYETAGFFCCTSQFGREHQLGLVRGIEHIEIEKEGEDLAERAVAWLRARRKRGERRPLFLWMHLIEPHGWEKSHPASADARRRTLRYDLSLADADRGLAVLTEEVLRGDAAARTYVVVTSDHGESLGDHGFKTHASSLYNSEIRVPLVVRGPRVTQGRIARPVGLADLAPTLLDLAGYVPPGMPAMDGRSFAPVLRREAPIGIEHGDGYSAMIADRSVEREMRAVVDGRYKLIWNGGDVELYDYVADPAEARNIAVQQPEVAKRLRVRLTQRRETDEVDPF
ncbi:MAG TPA: sulfatase [Kofleriaceae bacterium]|nr:sulfatase [Kofleriaceae bacterium]